MMKKDNKYNRFNHEVIYLWEDENELFIKSVPGKGYFARFPGGKEYKIAATSDSVTRAEAAMKEVSKEEYENA